MVIFYSILLSTLIKITVGATIMKFYVNTWDKNKATLMTEYGHVLGYYNSIADALTTCNEWYIHNSREPRQQVDIQTAQYEIAYDNSAYI